MFNRTKYKGKKYVCQNCLQCFSREKILSEHKENCLVINGKRSVKLERGFISFKNYSKQIPVPFKIYADFECILGKVDGDIECSSNSSYTRKYQNHIPWSFAYKVVCVDNKFSKKIVLYREKDADLSAEENERFELTNICWICSKFIENSDDKVRDFVM